MNWFIHFITFGSEIVHNIFTIIGWIFVCLFVGALILGITIETVDWLSIIIRRCKIKIYKHVYYIGDITDRLDYFDNHKEFLNENKIKYFRHDDVISFKSEKDYIF